jgi:cellulose 1,4-beta-cellobiosidase
MKPTNRLKDRSWTSLALGTAMLATGLAACGSDSGAKFRPDGGLQSEAGVPEAGAPLDVSVASEAGRFPAEVTVSTCQDFANVPVGSYIVQSDYWNKSACPGTQCMDIDKATGAFTVTQGPAACGNTVASYPNVLYGCAFGNCSPGSLLPMQVSTLSTVTSSWDFHVGGTVSDQYDVAYDIWFCPDEGCGPSGFANGTELMIWLDYKNVTGWQNDLGPVTLAGHNWEVWQATMGSSPSSWTYLAYMIQPSTVTSVADLDLGAFFRDAAARGIIQNSWYLYAIQAGNELRTGAIPYDSNSFSVSINGVTPSTTPVAVTGGPSCDGGVPTAEGSLKVNNNYVSAGPLHGYAAAWTWVGAGSNAIACAAPACTAPGSLQVTAILNNGVSPLTAEPVSCSPAFAPSALCTAGTVTGDPTYNQVAGVGFNLNQDLTGGTVDGGVAVDGGVDSDGGVAVDSGAAGGVGAINIGTSITVSLAKSGTLAGNSALRLQLTDVNNNFYCYGGTLQSGVPIPIGRFNTQCWSNAGQFAKPSTLFKRVDVLVPGTASTEEPFAFCLSDVVVE